MEKILSQSPPAKTQDENLNLKSDLYGTGSSLKKEASELNNEERSKKNLIFEDTQLSENCDSLLFFNDPPEKTETLLESAFRVMKILFSPEKQKQKNDKSNSVNEVKGGVKKESESSSSSSNLSSKEKLIISESEIETPAMKSTLLEGNDLNDKKRLSIPMINSLDFQSNDDDSFFTTISYDESFKSAITHFDENGEVIKGCDNTSYSVLNNSQDLDIAESCNSSLENSEYFLEKTMLKNDNGSSKEINYNNCSVTGSSDCNVEVPNPDCSYPTSGIQIEIFNSNGLGSLGQPDDELIGKNSDLNAEISALHSISEELDFQESDINCGEMILKNGNQIRGQVTDQGLQEFEGMPQLTFCLSSEAEHVNLGQNNEAICTENINVDFVGMENFKTKKSVMEKRCKSPSPQLSKSDLNEVDEVPLALKDDSGSFTSRNSFNKNYVLFTSTETHSITKNSDLIYANASVKAEPEFPVSPDISRLDKTKEFLKNRISHKFVDKHDIFMEKQPSVVLSSKKEGGKLVEPHKQEQNRLNIVDPSNSNLNEKKGNDYEGLNFEKNDSHVSVTQNDCGSLFHNERSVMLADDVSINNSSYVSSLTATNSEIQKSGKEDDFESANIFIGEAENVSSLKHSTPVSVLRSNSPICSNDEKLNMNSLEISKESVNKINNELHGARSDFLSKAMGIFFEPSNPSISAESSSSLTPAQPFTETIKSPVIRCELNKSKKPTQNLRERSGSPSAGDLTYEINHVESNEEAVVEKLDFSESNPTLDEKSGSFEREKSKLEGSLKLKRSKDLKVSGMANKSCDKVSDIGDANFLSLSFTKMVDSKCETDKSLNELNCRHGKESSLERDSRCDVNEVNKILEKSLGFISDKERSELEESQEADNFLSPIKEPPELLCQTAPASENESLKDNIDIDCVYMNEENSSFFSASVSPSHSSGNSSLLKTQIAATSNQIMENLTEIHLIEEPNVFGQLKDEAKNANYEAMFPEELSKNIEPDVAQLIEEQFTPNDIAKICDIVTLSEGLHDERFKAKEGETDPKVKNVLSPKSFDFLDSIQGKPTGRDLSRESLYVKFDPLVQPPTANSLIDFTKEVEALAASETSPAHDKSSICEELLAISPEKKSDAIVPPLTPLSDRNKKDKVERQKELQNEIYFLRNLYAERERLNKAKMEEYESQIAKLTGDKCVLDDKLKECVEREKSIVKKITSQTREIEQLKVVMKEYVKVISVLSTELETTRKESAKEIEALNAEKESYMNHLLNTEAAFSDVHTKYEKSKRTIESLKLNEVLYRDTISEHAQKVEEYKKKAKEAQEKALREYQNILEELQESKNVHGQEMSRLRAQLKKTELKLEALQESLDQKIKENQQLTAICDELIEGKK